jgi:hypothetical protein
MSIKSSDAPPLRNLKYPKATDEQKEAYSKQITELLRSPVDERESLPVIVYDKLNRWRAIYEMEESWKYMPEEMKLACRQEMTDEISKYGKITSPNSILGKAYARIFSHNGSVEM